MFLLVVVVLAQEECGYGTDPSRVPLKSEFKVKVTRDALNNAEIYLYIKTPKIQKRHTPLTDTQFANHMGRNERGHRER